LGIRPGCIHGKREVAKGEKEQSIGGIRENGICRVRSGGKGVLDGFLSAYERECSEIILQGRMLHFVRGGDRGNETMWERGNVNVHPEEKRV
jgi:hypothetical protein